MNRVDFFEVVWAVISTFVVIFHISTLIDALRARQAVRLSQRNGAMLLLVRAGVWKETTRLIGQTMLLLAGVVALTTPPPGCDPQMTTGRVLVVTLLLGFQGIMLINSVLETTTRLKFEELEDGAR